MHAELVETAGCEPYVIIRFAENRSIYVAALDRNGRLVCTIHFYRRTENGILLHEGNVYLDRYGKTIPSKFAAPLAGYWKSLPDFGPLMDMAVGAGLDLTGLISLAESHGV